LQRSSNGTVPSGTRTVLVCSMLRTDGTANDGYADDLSLVFSGLTAAVAATCPANGSQPAGAGGSSGGQAASGSRVQEGTALRGLRLARRVPAAPGGFGLHAQRRTFRAWWRRLQNSRQVNR